MLAVTVERSRTVNNKVGGPTQKCLDSGRDGRLAPEIVELGVLHDKIRAHCDQPRIEQYFHKHTIVFMARIQVNHHRPTSFSGLTPHDFIKVTLVRPALQKLHVPLPWLCVPRSDAFFADWAEPVGAKHGFWWISVYAQHASIKPQGLEQRREEKCEAPLIGTRLNDETRLHSEDYVLQVHQVLRILQHLCPQPSTIAIHRVALEESVISIHDSGLIWLKQL
mmetsp:Transcript_7539/g.13903  ORF Transcript_7539/g.13903 Transcript_7539/m.13903 type:complete len:222 (-) Transcript_7539:264-929(-)